MKTHAPKEIGMAKFRATFGEVLTEVEKEQQSYLVKKHGRVTVAIVPASWLTSPGQVTPEAAPDASE